MFEPLAGPVQAKEKKNVAEPIFLPEGLLSPVSRLVRLLQGEPFKRDAQTFLSIDETVFEHLNEVLEAATGPIGQRRLMRLVKPILEDASQAFVNFAWNFHTFKSDFPQVSLEEQIERRAANLYAEDPEAAKKLVSRVRRLMERKPGLELQMKVLSVAARASNPLSEASLTSDLRPVMDNSGDRVEAMLPITTLKVEVVTDNGPVAVEARVSESELLQLQKDVARALTKLQTLKAFVRKSSVPLPESDLLEEDA